MSERAEMEQSAFIAPKKTWMFTGLFGKTDKPHSNPYNWPNSTEMAISERPNRVINVGKEQNFSFNDNFVKTSKYTLWSFLPKFLIEEFNPKTKIANCYFLLISGLQCIPRITNTGGVPTTLLPLLGVLMVDAIFLILEDRSRHRADYAANSSMTHRLNPQTEVFEQCKWSELQVGDLVQINSRDSVPADIAIVSVSEKNSPPQGLCYVETKSLDGETNLKVRSALPITYSKV